MYNTYVWGLCYMITILCIVVQDTESDVKARQKQMDKLRDTAQVYREELENGTYKIYILPPKIAYYIPIYQLISMAILRSKIIE